MNYLPFHKNIYSKLDGFIQKNNIPHIIFHGNSGSGKRTIVNDFINKIYNFDKVNIKQNVLLVNCAHGKGIKFIREDLKFFAKSNLQKNSGVFFKTILLINAGYLTMDAQSALRRCIEQFSYNTRFFIILEDKNKLLNPILSRFCEIYVPDLINEKNEIVSLHKHFTNKKYNLENGEELGKKIREELGKIEKTHKNLVEISEEWYNEGISCLDLVNILKEDESLDKNLKYKTSMCFEKIKSEYRNEKLLMFYILDYLYIRSNKDLKCIMLL
jgi:DNA polymerase III delta prime subunit